MDISATCTLPDIRFKFLMVGGRQRRQIIHYSASTDASFRRSTKLVGPRLCSAQSRKCRAEIPVSFPPEVRGFRSRQRVAQVVGIRLKISGLDSATERSKPSGNASQRT